MKLFFKNNHRIVFYGTWLLLGLIQAGLTELQDDEAYYWVFSRYLDWGYFDHPPMIALLVKMGYAIFPNEMGVRLFPLLLNIFTLVIIEKLLNKKNPLLFYAIALSVAVIQIGGFFAVPDIPLIFFTALFFLCYKRFTENLSWINTLLLGIAVALLLYSKYHAVLIVLFTLVSEIKLFKKYQTYIAGIVALLLFAPHLWWQYQHDWISFRYHLFESNVNPYKPSFTLNYVLGQLLMPGPIAGLILLPAALLYKTKDKLEKAMRFTMIGIYLFFLLSSFRGKVEANWTTPALVCLIILSHQYLIEKTSWQKWLIRMLPVTLVLVLFVRIVMIEDILPVKAIKERYHSWKSWPMEMKEKTKGLPVVISNSYQRASKYWFYTGQKTYSQNLYKQRRNNYNFWPIEDSLLGKPVYFFDMYDLDRFPETMKTPIGTIGYRLDSSFASFAKIKIETDEKKFRVRKIDSLTVSGFTKMPPAYYNYIKEHERLKSRIILSVFNKYGWIKDFETPLTIQDITQNDFRFTFYPQLEKGDYFLLFAIGIDFYYPTHNSDKIKLSVE
jgi:Dolichyl-phosphate-mannose-protein mannosyltransferase